jgi:hypothetical protein
MFQTKSETLLSMGGAAMLAHDPSTQREAVRRAIRVAIGESDSWQWWWRPVVEPGMVPVGAGGGGGTTAVPGGGLASPAMTAPGVKVRVGVGGAIIGGD